LVNDKELKLKLGKQGREDVAQKFSLEKMLKEIEKIYSKIL
jgi:glycosyltransferase involved in cell wall biosynthesis